MECTNNTIENDSNLTITETDLSENVTSLNTVMDLAGIITGRKKCSELTRDEKYRYYKIILHLLKTITFSFIKEK